MSIRYKVCDVCGLEINAGNFRTISPEFQLPDIKHVCDYCEKRIQHCHDGIDQLMEYHKKCWLQEFMRSVKLMYEKGHRPKRSAIYEPG